jgi:ABC-type transport system involved in multi-copper enzyme maturation permease subunit
MCTVKQFKHKMKCCYIKYADHIFQFNVYIPARTDIRDTSFTALPSTPSYDSCTNLSLLSAVITCNLNSKESHKGLIQHLFTILFVSQATIKGT